MTHLHKLHYRDTNVASNHPRGADNAVKWYQLSSRKQWRCFVFFPQVWSRKREVGSAEVTFPLRDQRYQWQLCFLTVILRPFTHIRGQRSPRTPSTQTKMAQESGKGISSGLLLTLQRSMRAALGKCPISTSWSPAPSLLEVLPYFIGQHRENNWDLWVMWLCALLS